MTKLRDNTGIILWILVVSFGGLWVLQDSGVFETIGVVGQDIAVVNGESITYEEYNNALERQLDAYQAQTGESAPPQLMDMQRDQIYQALVDDRLRQQAMDRLGVTVTDDEVYEMILGENPHPIIRNIFPDGEGGVNTAVLQSFVDNPEALRQQLGVDLAGLEQILRAERRREKLDNLIQATVRITEQEVLDEYLRRNKTVDAQYVALRYASLPDDSVQVTDSDLQAFYNANREDFRRNRAYSVNYVTLPKVPSAADTAAVLQDIENLRERFAEADDDSLFLARNASEVPYSDATFRADELEGPIAEAVFENPEPGRIVGPIVSGGQVHLIKIVGTEPADETVVRARHILLRAPEGDEEARAAARAQANELRQRIQDGEDFATLAREYSDDGSASRGGDLGWFGRGRMVPSFDEAAFSASVGEVTPLVETQFGVHLIQVTERAEEAVRVADYAMTLRPSVTTLTSTEELLEDVQYFTSESDGDFTGEAQRANLNVSTVQIEEDQQFVPGIGNSRQLMNFLADADEGSLSDVIELNDQFIVAQVAGVQEEGYRSFDEVRSELEPRVRTEKKKDIQRERLQRALAANPELNAVASAVGVNVREANGLSLNDPVVSGLGREPSLVGAAFGLNEGERSGVLTGQNAVYVVAATSVNEPAPLTETQKSQIRSQLLEQRRNQVQQQWIAALRDDATIDDRRRLFQE